MSDIKPIDSNKRPQFGNRFLPANADDAEEITYKFNAW